MQIQVRTEDCSAQRTPLLVVSQSSALVGGAVRRSRTWLLDRLLWATLCADKIPWAQPGVALSNKEEGWRRDRERSHVLNAVKFNTRKCNTSFVLFFLFYLGYFDATVLFLSLVCGGIVVPGAVVVDQLPVPLGYTCLNERQENGYLCWWPDVKCLSFLIVSWAKTCFFSLASRCG